MLKPSSYLHRMTRAPRSRSATATTGPMARRKRSSSISSANIQQAATMLITATNDLRLSAGASEATADKRNAPSSNPSGLIRGYRQGFLDFAPPPTTKQRTPDI